ncbi:UDP-glucose 4-epimerase GalE [Bacillus mycoides]|uniref:UDP-glucose 4-epimerase GalE n=1 Tax=Bacillus mycoides TaxID=1405 RepID=UPI000279850B|nr:UDP-glucose 4-epimerase GalE [Bacillus mycoides]EJS00689.1 UDP-glucose 4-epimerase [Bacillus cereus VDM034]EJS16404.1 UDP-glucose 4-epimerase [Bacillus cereus VDM062]MBG9687096.1 UDP-glucose 4-epimerase [Bacillus mycoides]QWI24601.1 UDP-glucose 4-epimerase GalE [Bacillus mycoides]
MSSILVCGGAGYIGSHAVKKLIDEGLSVVVVDNLQTGHEDAITEGAKFYKGDLRDKGFLRDVFKQENIEVVMHFAADSLVGVSMEKPLQYYNNNVYGALCLLEVMDEFKVDKFIFSSTAATYGEVDVDLITEETLTNPTNTYGETKLAIEKMLHCYSRASNLKYKIFRYFNVAGATPSGIIGEDHRPETHLIPLVLQVALGQREKIIMFGEDYNTPDGTCIRDYIHVEDLVAAHFLGLKDLQKGGESDFYNLGNGNGFSVKEIVEAVREVTNHEIPAEVAPRRAGDPARLVASSQKAKEKLGWNPQYVEVKTIIEHAWNWHQKKPHGYEK